MPTPWLILRYGKKKKLPTCSIPVELKIRERLPAKPVGSIIGIFIINSLT